MIKYLESYNVQFHYHTKVVNVEFDIQPDKKAAKRIDILFEGKEDSIDLTEEDLVFITNGGCVENSSIGSQNTSAPFNSKIKRRRRLGYVAENRSTGFSLWQPRQVLLRPGKE